MSCNGCRVLRKGCSDSCALRPCLQWIEGAEAQGHATVFVAKFFGRAGLMGFIAAVPENQRPALFRSLLYEACGRTVNPVYGAVGLLWSGNWHVCQAAVDTVLRGGSLKPVGGASPANLPCYGPMPNLPRLHMKSSADHLQNQQAQEDVKRFKAFDRSSLENNSTSNAVAAGTLVSLAATDDTKPCVFQPGSNKTGLARPSDQAQKRTALIAVKRERDEPPEIIAPVARRARVAHQTACQLEPIGAAEVETIDLDLTLSSHPPTPQLFLPARKNVCGGEPGCAPTGVAGATGGASNHHFGTNRVASPVSCSNSFSSEGSVTSLDTADFIASGANAPGMDLLQRMEKRHLHHHHQHQSDLAKKQDLQQ